MSKNCLTRSVSMPGAVWDILDEVRGDLSRGRMIAKALSLYVDTIAPKPSVPENVRYLPGGGVEVLVPCAK